MRLRLSLRLPVSPMLQVSASVSTAMDPDAETKWPLGVTATYILLRPTSVLREPLTALSAETMHRRAAITARCTPVDVVQLFGS